MRALIFILSTLLLSPSLVTADTLIDRFEAEATNTRLSERGDWKFADGIASCVSDPELYKKFSNHGPILKWPNQFKNATIECEIKAEDCGRVVFTINGDGHIFRITLADERDEAPAGKSKVPTRLIAWAEKSSKQNKGDTLIPSGMPDLPSINGRWIPLRFEIRGRGRLHHYWGFQDENQSSRSPTRQEHRHANFCSWQTLGKEF